VPRTTGNNGSLEIVPVNEPAVFPASEGFFCGVPSINISTCGKP